MTEKKNREQRRAIGQAAMDRAKKEFPGVNPNNWGPFGHLPDLTTESIEELLTLEDWKLAVKELIIHTVRLEGRVNGLGEVVDRFVDRAKKADSND